MRKKRNFESLQTLAHGRESRWQRHVSSQLSNLQTEEQRLQQLHNYVDEYNRPVADRRDSQSILAMRSQRQFVDRLKDAVKRQSQTVADKRAAADQGIRQWKHERSKRLAIQKFSERQQAIADKLRDRRSQAVLDEVGRNGFLAKK